jgi:hypothetical protein
VKLPFAILGYARDRDDLQVTIDAATDLAAHQVRRGYAPPWWEGRARYRRESHETFPGVERINLPEEVEALGADDCDGHAPYLAGSLIAAGHPARAVVIRSPGVGYHVIVSTLDSDGRTLILDPSARRGMLDEREPALEGARLDRFKRRARAALARAGQLVARIERMNPGSVAARGLALEAVRQLAIAKQATRQSEQTSDEP